MRSIWLFFLLISISGQAQWKKFIIGVNGDTLNRVDQRDLKQGPWVVRVESIRGEPGYEEEGVFKNNKKEGTWRIFSLTGDLIGKEDYKWGMKDGICAYYSTMGELRLEQGWKALNPEKLYDTLLIEDIDRIGSYKKVILKNEGASLKHGVWNYYDGGGNIIRREQYELGKLLPPDPFFNSIKKPVNPVPANPKPKELLEYEKKMKKKNE